MYRLVTKHSDELKSKIGLQFETVGHISEYSS